MSSSLQSKARAMFASDKPALIAHCSLMALQLASLFVPVPTSFNIVVSAALCVYCGSWRSIKAAGPKEDEVMSRHGEEPDLNCHASRITN